MRFARTFIAYLVIFIVALPTNAATGLGCQGELTDAPAAEKHHSNYPMTLEDPHALHRGESDSDKAPPGRDSICDCCDVLCSVNGCAPAAAFAAFKQKLVNVNDASSVTHEQEGLAMPVSIFTLHTF